MLVPDVNDTTQFAKSRRAITCLSYACYMLKDDPNFDRLQGHKKREIQRFADHWSNIFQRAQLQCELRDVGDTHLCVVIWILSNNSGGSIQEGNDDRSKAQATCKWHQ